MRIGVTGGKGMIGSVLATRLSGMGHEVTVFDDGSRGKNKPEAAGYETMDLRKTVPRFDGIDAVFHLAARVGGTKFTHGPSNSRAMFDNLAIDSNVLQGAVDAGVSKFLFASSGSVYPLSRMKGDNPPLYERMTLRIDDIESGYAVAKLATEAMMNSLHKTRELESISILRLFNVYGPGCSLEYPHIIADLLNRGLRERHLKLFDDGSGVRAFLYVDDAVDAFIAAFNSKYPGPVNIGSDKEVTIRELAEMIAVLTRSTVSYSGKEPEGVTTCIPELDYASIALKWKPKTPLMDGLKMTKEYIERC